MTRERGLLTQIKQHTDGSPRVLLYHGPQRGRLEALSLMLYDVIITTYSILVSVLVLRDACAVCVCAGVPYLVRACRVLGLVVMSDADVSSMILVCRVGCA